MKTLTSNRPSRSEAKQLMPSRGWATSILISLVALILVSGTYVLELAVSAKAEAKETPGVTIVEKGDDGSVKHEENIYTASSGKSERMVLLFGKNVVYRLDKGAEAQFVPTTDKNGNRKIAVDLKSGRVWINSINSTASTEIKTKNLNVAADSGVFDIEYSGGNLRVASHRRSAKVEFFGNKLVVPEGREISLSETKLERGKDTISVLRYSKLSKEFPYFEIKKSDAWVDKNKKDDDAFTRIYKSELDHELRLAGPKLSSDKKSLFFRLSDFTRNVNIDWTIDPVVRTEKETAQAFDYVTAALYAYFIGDNVTADIFTSDFVVYARENRSSESFSVAAARIKDELAFARPGDSFFVLLAAARDNSRSTVISNLHERLNDVLDSAESGTDQETFQRTTALLRQYGSVTDSKIAKISDEKIAKDILFEYVSLNDFMDRNKRFLKEEFLKILELYERAYVDLIASKEEAADERQFLINEKIKKIQTIKGLMESQDLPFQDGRAGIIFLANQIETLKLTVTDTAVMTYFEEQLAGLAPFLAFLRSSSADNLHGSFEEEFKTFQSGIEQIKKVSELLTNSSGGTQISASRREELASSVSADLEEVGVSGIEISLPEDEEDSRVKVAAARLEGKPFTATYDTVRKIFSDIVIDGEEVPNAIRLANLQKFFLIRQGRLILPTGVSADSFVEGPTKASLLERVAKVKLLEGLQKLGIEVEDKYLSFQNLDEDIVHIRLALLGEASDAKVFSFDLVSKMSLVENLKVQTVAGEIPVNDKFALRELPFKVEQIYARALFEKQRGEELENFMVPGTSTEVQ